MNIYWNLLAQTNFDPDINYVESSKVKKKKKQTNKHLNIWASQPSQDENFIYQRWSGIEKVLKTNRKTIYRQLRARRALLQFIKCVVDNQKGAITIDYAQW